MCPPQKRYWVSFIEKRKYPTTVLQKQSLRSRFFFLRIGTHTCTRCMLTNILWWVWLKNEKRNPFIISYLSSFMYVVCGPIPRQWFYCILRKTCHSIESLKCLDKKKIFFRTIESKLKNYVWPKMQSVKKIRGSSQSEINRFVRRNTPSPINI